MIPAAILILILVCANVLSMIYQSVRQSRTDNRIAALEKRIGETEMNVDTLFINYTSIPIAHHATKPSSLARNNT